MFHKGGLTEYWGRRHFKNEKSKDSGEIVEMLGVLGDSLIISCAWNIESILDCAAS